MDGVQMTRMGKYYVMERPRVIGICHYCREYVDTWNRMIETIVTLRDTADTVNRIATTATVYVFFGSLSEFS